LGIRCQVEVGDCEMFVYDFNSTTGRSEEIPFLTMKLANFDKHESGLLENDLKNQLSQVKFQLTSSRAIQDELDNVINDLQEELNRERVHAVTMRKKLEAELGALEKQLISAKMALAEFQSRTIF